jgi:hypothetical protein
MRIGSICFLLFLFGSAAIAQQTVFNVPSVDVLDKGKIYSELDMTFRSQDFMFIPTPRVVLGVGHRVEVGLNVVGIQYSSTDVNHTTLSPAIKWKAYDSGANGWSFFVGDNIFLPVQNRTYDAGNYAYAMLAKQWGFGPRIGAGAYHFSKDVAASSQRAGGQFSIEQTLNQRVTLAADWYTGNHSYGYFTPGITVKATKKLTLYGSYEIGNAGVKQGNHLLEVEVGWNFN